MPKPKRSWKPSADRILEAAEKAFAKHGYHEVSLRQLMAAAEISTTAFYARFDSKEQVLAALTQRLFEDLYADAPVVLARARDLEAGIELGVELMCDRFGPKRALVRLILAEAGGSPVTIDARRRSYGMLAAFLAVRIAALRDRNKLAVADPVALAWALIGALELQVMRWAVWDEIDLPTLRTSLRSAARALLPRKDTP